MSDVFARFGSALREVRLRQALTQEQLAERAGLTYKAIGEIERGRGNPRLATMNRLADALGVNLRDLLPGGAAGSEPQDYRITDALQVVRDALDSIEVALSNSVTYARKRRSRRS